MIRLIVDSTFGVKKDYALKHKIFVVNLKMNLANETFEEGFEETWGDFYYKMQKSSVFPTTSQPSPQDFIDKMEEVYKEDENAEILILTISERLSGTINSAKIAANSFPNKKIVALDSRQATTCGRFMVEELVEAIENGRTFDEVISLVSVLQSKLKIQFIPHTLEYLRRGGRIGAVGAGLASILKIKPVFTFSDGNLTVKKVIGNLRAASEVVNNTPEAVKKIAVCYIYDDSNVDKIMQKIKDRFPDGACIEKTAIEPVFGCHVGIGAVGVATLEE